eukprot:gb/GECH01011419.1/.p1 GENE.gb/GECH01011419.1/~~gb/GECH01011419.1/.p1  ORF type:complete len:104 (+),score=16.84 gb/GECH01011419.1/:1-312(+)
MRAMEFLRFVDPLVQQSFRVLEELDADPGLASRGVVDAAENVANEFSITGRYFNLGQLLAVTLLDDFAGTEGGAEVGPFGFGLEDHVCGAVDGVGIGEGIEEC